MILSDRMILNAMEVGDIVIEPFDRAALGTNSYDVHLGPTLATYIREPDLEWRPRYRCTRCDQSFHDWNGYAEHSFEHPSQSSFVREEVHVDDPSRVRLREDVAPLDCKRQPKTQLHSIGPEGFVLRPGVLYLGATKEYTETRRHVPFLDGKSSIGRLGITIHCTAGRGDVGFKNHWTLEIHVVEPVRIYVDMPIGQLIYFETGDVDVPYDRKPSAKYNGRNPDPIPSWMFLNFRRDA